MRAKDEIIASISAYPVAREEAAEEMRGSTIKIWTLSRLCLNCIMIQSIINRSKGKHLVPPFYVQGN